MNGWVNSAIDDSNARELENGLHRRTEKENKATAATGNFVSFVFF